MSSASGSARRSGAKVIQAYRFALNPAPAQERMLRSHAGAARFAWNWGLARCQERYQAEGSWYSGIELHKLWNAGKKADPALAWWGGELQMRLPGGVSGSGAGAARLHQTEEGSAEGTAAGLSAIQETRQVPGLVPVQHRCHRLCRENRDACRGWARSTPMSPPVSSRAGWGQGRPASCRPRCPVPPGGGSCRSRSKPGARSRDATPGRVGYRGRPRRRPY